MLKILKYAVLALLLAGCAIEPIEVTKAKQSKWNPIKDGIYSTSINRGLKISKGKLISYSQYSSDQIIHIAENLIAGQNSNGGWPKNKDWTRLFPNRDYSELEGKSTLDNQATWLQIDYLAQVYQQTKIRRYAESAMEGIEYILEEQRVQEDGEELMSRLSLLTMV